VDQRRDPARGDTPQTGEPPVRRASVARVAWEWSRSILIAFGLFLVLRTVGVEAFKIPTSSMESTLLVGDFLLVNKAVYGAHLPGTDLQLPALRQPTRGDIVVFHPPHEPRRNYVKRVVGIPGDTLEMRNKQLLLNGEEVDEPFAVYLDDRGDAVHPDMNWQRNHLIAKAPSDGSYHPSRDNWGPIVIPDAQYFVLGDNRDNSEDSRYWGLVDRDQIRGRPWFVYYSQQRASGEDASWMDRVRWGRIGHAIR